MATKYFDVDGVRERVPVSRQIVYRAVRNGQLRVVRFGAGRHWLTCDEFVDQWIAEHLTPRERVEPKR